MADCDFSREETALELCLSSQQLVLELMLLYVRFLYSFGSKTTAWNISVVF